MGNRWLLKFSVTVTILGLPRICEERLILCFLLKAQITQKKINLLKNSSEYDQEIPQSQTAEIPMAPRGRATHQSRDTRKTN